MINTFLNTIVTRCSVITTNIVKRSRQFTAATELPGIAVYRGRATQQELHPSGQKIMQAPVYVDYYKAQATTDPATEADAMLSALYAAIEVDDSSACEPVVIEEDEANIPADDSGVIAVQVQINYEYHIPYGGPSA